MIIFDNTTKSPGLFVIDTRWVTWALRSRSGRINLATSHEHNDSSYQLVTLCSRLKRGLGNHHSLKSANRLFLKQSTNI